MLGLISPSRQLPISAKHARKGRQLQDIPFPAEIGDDFKLSILITEERNYESSYWQPY